MIKQIYLDHNATTPVDEEVLRQIMKIASFPYNSSSMHYFGKEARRILERARQSIAQALGVGGPDTSFQVIFTASGSEANNMAISSFSKDCQLIISATEHISVLKLARQVGCDIIGVDQNGLLDLSHLVRALEATGKPKFISVMLANNETGVIQDIESITRIAHQYGAVVHCDASQAFGKIAVNLPKLGVDLLTISGHKCGGSMGAACLVAKKTIVKQWLKQMICGGDQEFGLRAGTENLPAIAGFGFVANQISEKLRKIEKLRELRDYLEAEVVKYAKDAYIIGMKVLRLPNTSCLAMPGVSSETQLINFDLAGIAVSKGAACSVGRVAKSYVLEAMGLGDEITNNAIRVSLGCGNEEREIKFFVDKWLELYNRTRRETGSLVESV